MSGQKAWPSLARNRGLSPITLLQDNFSVLTEGTDLVIGPVDLDALIVHIENLPQPFDAAPEGRISVAP